MHGPMLKRSRGTCGPANGVCVCVRFMSFSLFLSLSFCLRTLLHKCCTHDPDVETSLGVAGLWHRSVNLVRIRWHDGVHEATCGLGRNMRAATNKHAAGHTHAQCSNPATRRRPCKPTRLPAEEICTAPAAAWWTSRRRAGNVLGCGGFAGSSMQ